MINIIDAICGSGKTSYAIQMIKSNPEKSYVYITPYLREIARIKHECPGFSEPSQLGEGKFSHFQNLLINGSNITSTHALFRMSTQETRDLISCHNYCLILDEVMDIIEELPLKKDDLPAILANGYAEVDDNGYLIWKDQDYEGRYNDIKIMCENRSIFVVNGCCLMWTFPADIFKSFKEVYVLTYMFNSQLQRYYYDLHEIDYRFLSVRAAGNSYELCEYVEGKDKPKIDIDIYEGKLNTIGDDETALSVSWYSAKKQDNRIKILKNNVYNYIRNVVNTKGSNVLWTTFKDYRQRVRGKGYSNSFLSSNARATNDYQDRDTVVYPINKYLSPMIIQFFNKYAIKVNEDAWALSEVVQFLYRSSVRNGHSIHLYIPSRRMRNLVNTWLAL